MKRLSIIVPAYNVEKYIFRSLNSILNQDISPDEYEVIVVNDGSSDNTLKIVEQIASLHSNIKIITQINQGVGVARNSGISKACGRYIWFVDSDDWIRPDSLALLLSIAESCDVDLLCFDYLRTNEYVEVSAPINGNNDIKKEYFSSQELLQKKIRHKFFLFCHFFKREIIIQHKLSFENLRMCEDVPFLASYLVCAKKIVYANIEAYYYYNRPGSIVNTYTLKHATDILTAYESLCGTLSVYTKDKKFEAYLNNLLVTQIIWVFRMGKRMDRQAQHDLICFFRKSKLSHFKVVFWGISFRKYLTSLKIKYKLDRFFD